MIATLQQNIPGLIQSFGKLTTIYIKQYGPGNLRLASNKEDLQNTINASLQDGIAQTTADGWKQYFWEGDLWVISDQAGSLVLQAPSYAFYIERTTGTTPAKSTGTRPAGSLSTY